MGQHAYNMRRSSKQSTSHLTSARKVTITTANITMQFGAKPLFENISVKFGNGNRYGLIGANGCGKSPLKILSGELSPLVETFQLM